MLSETWFPLVTLCCIAWIIRIFMSNRSSTQPPLPPGPMGLPIVGMLPFLDPQLHTYFTRLAQTYGPLLSLRLGRKTVIVVSSPLLAKEVLKDFDITFANHDVSAASRAVSYGRNDIPFSPYGPVWRMLRKAGKNGMLSASAVDAASKIRRQWLHQAILHLQEQAGFPVNVGDQVFVMVSSVITSMLWGKSMETARDGAEFRREVTQALELAGSPNVSDFFPILARFDLQGVVKKMQHCIKRMDVMIEGLIHKIDGNYNGDDSKDFLHYLLQLKDNGDGETRITMSQLKALLIDMILAGMDTTTNTLESAMTEMMNKPQVMRRAQQELEAVVGANNRVDESHIHQLPYLHAIMKETLRLNPTVPLLVPRSPTESCIVGGHTIPKGCAVFFNVWAIHRDPSLWEDPLEFKPERFLDGKCQYYGNNFTYFPFGSGRRICAGIALAERMILFSLASLVHYFDWELPKGVDKLDRSVEFGFTLKKATPLILIPSPRPSLKGELCSS